MTGPLAGLRVLEIASAAPAPFACMVLADLGAEVVRIDRPASAKRAPAPAHDPLSRGRRSIAMDLKHPDAASVVRELARAADVIVEGFRPGVMERLGVGPDVLLAENPRLVYGRMTGWGQTGPMAAKAGHDINYIALSGALEPLGRAGEAPHAPLNLLGDFGGGGMLLAVGVLAALVERSISGHGQVVDAAMVDGSALLGTFLYGLRAQGFWSDQRGTNLLDGGAPFYDTYATSDGGYMSVGALEPQFYGDLLVGLGLDGEDLPRQMDRAGWPVLRARIAGAFASRTRAEWTAVFATLDACVSPVLSPAEAAADPHNRARGAFVNVGGLTQPAPAPRFSRTSPGLPVVAPAIGADTTDALLDWGLDAARLAALRSSGALAQEAAVEVAV
ncbi:MAG: CaiB/BaiF CoA transferase family protein [Sporichthyaceae bacterium]